MPQPLSKIPGSRVASVGEPQSGEPQSWDGSLPETIDLGRMRRQRHERLQRAMADQGIGATLLFGAGAVQYAAGAHLVGADAGRATHQRTSVLVVAGDPQPHVFSATAATADLDLDADHRHRAWYLESDDGVMAMAGSLRDVIGQLPERLAVDDLSGPCFGLRERCFPDVELLEASSVLGPARVCKTPDEIACIRAAQHVNELAMIAVQEALRPGVRQCELTGIFLRRAFELGATSNGIDPIWQAMAPSLARGPVTAAGEVAFPLITTDRILCDGEVIWVDSGVHVHGYAADFGRTWIVGDDPRPSPRQQEQFRRWCDVVTAVLARIRPGATGADLTAAAREAARGTTPWLSHFYLIHGLGTESAEAPMIGTDLGAAHDERIVLTPGMVLVLEPVIWDDGCAGYRSEEVVAVTDSGWIALSDHPYDPYGPASPFYRYGPDSPVADGAPGAARANSGGEQ